MSHCNGSGGLKACAECGMGPCVEGIRPALQCERKGNQFIKPPPGMSVADKMADGNRLQFLITIGARVTMPTGIVIGADNQAFRAAVDLAMELAKNG